MAKQTFTTGQVLTAAQMNSLQSNDFNQTVSVKTASYVLVAADKGTRIEFNTSGSVTCTVNTGLFDAGDTLIIQNRGAGAVTVTAGTATVNTSATLVLSRYDSGTLYFISASAAIFFNTDAGGGSPLTTKGDIFVFGTADDRLPIGTNDYVLTADSSQSLGMKWAAAAAGGYTLLTSGSLSGSSVAMSSISGSYRDLVLIVRDFLPGTSNAQLRGRYNNDSSNNYSWTTNNAPVAATFDNGFFDMTAGANSSTANGITHFRIYDYANTATWKSAEVTAVVLNATNAAQWNGTRTFVVYNQTNAIDRIDLLLSTGSFTSGDYYLYGVK